MSAPPRARRVALSISLASAIICTFVYLAMTVQGSWFSSAKTLHWTPRELSVTEGTAQLRSDGLAVRPSDATRPVRIAVNTSLRASDYPVFGWETAGVSDDVEAAVLWQNEYEPGRVFNQRVDVEAGHVQPILLAQNKKWIGRISGIALAVRGNFLDPMVVRGATAKTMSPREVLGDRISEWFKFEPWNGTSINTLTGGADSQDMPLPVLLAAIACVAALAYAGLAWWKRDFFGPVLGISVAGVFVIAWLIIDARWEWNLLRQVRSTHAQYAGKSWHDRHLAAEDGPVFAFIHKVREQLPAPPARVFIVADAHYFRDRGAYHLYPHNVYFDPWANSMPPPAAMRPGDYIVVYQRRGVQYDPAQRRLRWDGSGVDAELLLVDTGAALFRIR